MPYGFDGLTNRQIADDWTKDDGVAMAMARDPTSAASVLAAAPSGQRTALLKCTAERAAHEANVSILRWCFDSGLEEIPPSGLNNELVHAACFSLSPDVFSVLIDHGLDLNGHHSEFIGDALSYAASCGSIELMRFLLENGTDPNKAWGCYEYDAAVWAVVEPKRSPEILQLMLQYGWTQENSTAHIAAAEIGDLDILELLVEAGADLECSEPWQDTPDSEGFRERGTALYRAALRGKEACASYLVRKGANPGYEDKLGRSCLWAAKEGGNEKIIRLLEQSN
ncbi:ankyrin repeat-containing protein [Astrocystis sublimbata]|nr:ankyrin repeat-containing protein [Astrocystis sublimbata]